MKLITILFILSYSSLYAQLHPKHLELNTCKDLIKKKATDLKLEECNKLFNQVMQLFYIYTDDVGAQKKDLIHPLYSNFYKLAQPAGIIINQYQAKPLVQLRKNIQNLRKEYKDPLLIGGDDCQGYLGKKRIRIKPLPEYTNNCQIRVNAAMTKVFGCNILFNPQIDKPISNPFESNYDKELIELAKKKIDIYKKFGTLLTLKHFPLTSNKYDLHDESPDNDISKKNITKNFLPAFKELMPHQGLLMTTHIINKSIDDKDIVTFSKKWVDLIREKLKIKSTLILTDSLDMIRKYSNELKSGSFNHKIPQVSQEGFFAIRSILAGHDVFMTRQSLIFQQLMLSHTFIIAALKLDISKQLRSSIEKSFKRVKAFKKEFKEYLDYFPKISKRDEKVIISSYKKIDKVKLKNCNNKKLKSALEKLEQFK